MQLVRRAAGDDAAWWHIGAWRVTPHTRTGQRATGNWGPLDGRCADPLDGPVVRLMVGLRRAGQDKDERDGHCRGGYEQDPDNPHLA